MSFLTSISRLITDPPPEHIFELSEAGIAYARSQGARGADTGFEPFPEGTLKASPVDDNVLRVDAFSALLNKIAPANGSKRRPAAVLLPDASVRVSVLDFDSFPETPEEQLSLVRFRVKKTVPFDIESAAVSYYRQPGPAGKRAKMEVVAVTVAHEVLARYEALFRGAGFHPGDIALSALSALNLYRDAEPAVIAKLAGNTLTVMVVAAGKLKLFRCLPLEDENNDDEIREVLYPTFAYAEDELSAPVTRLILCGFPRTPEGLPGNIEPLRAHLAAAGPFNAGLLGYLEARA
jgi:type IV pilus assembly protein PilM